MFHSSYNICARVIRFITKKPIIRSYNNNTKNSTIFPASTYSILESIRRNDAIREKYRPKTKNQELYTNYLKNPEYKLVIGCGTSGVGKTYLTTSSSIDALNNELVNKIIITTPDIIADNKRSYKLELFELYSRPVFDIFSLYFSKHEIEKMLTEKTVEYVPIDHMIGRTFNNSYIIADDMQNATVKQLLLLLTRVGDNNKLVINGNLHSMQSYKKTNGLDDFINRLHKNYGYHINQCLDNGISIVYFDDDDIQRNELVKSMLSLYKV